ncbi:MAG: sortase [Candidatus Paceibacterota bacterium]|jgi:LPXTG-site transpeptidase (sortase) family protein
MKIKKIILILACLILVLGAGYYFLFYNQDKAGNSIVDNTFGWKFPVTKFPAVGVGEKQIAYSNIRDSGGVPEGLPVRLKIPVIGVDSAIEDALITSDGRMDVPEGSVNVAWFALGPHPGEVGSAVIGGHFGIKKGISFVFYKLDTLKIGDKVYIENDKGETLAFQVRSTKLFDRNADATTVFTSNDGLSHLNLITCEGIWNKVNGNYPERRVVFTDAIQREGSISVKVPVSYQTLRIGAYGMDVVTLQTALDKKGISPGIIDGIFGKITWVAVSKYQTSVGLVSDGIFGPLTRAKLLLEQSQLAVNPTLPSTAIAPELLVSHNIFIQSVKILFRTPIDGLVTSIILALIIFVSFKLLRNKKNI